MEYKTVPVLPATAGEWIGWFAAHGHGGELSRAAGEYAAGLTVAFQLIAAHPETFGPFAAALDAELRASADLPEGMDLFATAAARSAQRLLSRLNGHEAPGSVG